MITSKSKLNFILKVTVTISYSKLIFKFFFSASNIEGKAHTSQTVQVATLPIVNHVEIETEVEREHNLNSVTNEESTLHVRINGVMFSESEDYANT